MRPQMSRPDALSRALLKASTSKRVDRATHNGSHALLKTSSEFSYTDTAGRDDVGVTT